MSCSPIPSRSGASGARLARRLAALVVIARELRRAGRRPASMRCAGASRRSRRDSANSQTADRDQGRGEEGQPAELVEGRSIPSLSGLPRRRPPAAQRAAEALQVRDQGDRFAARLASPSAMPSARRPAAMRSASARASRGGVLDLGVAVGVADAAQRGEAPRGERGVEGRRAAGTRRTACSSAARGRGGPRGGASATSRGTCHRPARGRAPCAASPTGRAGRRRLRRRRSARRSGPSLPRGAGPSGCGSCCSPRGCRGRGPRARGRCRGAGPAAARSGPAGRRAAPAAPGRRRSPRAKVSRVKRSDWPSRGRCHS